LSACGVVRKGLETKPDYIQASVDVICMIIFWSGSEERRIREQSVWSCRLASGTARGKGSQRLVDGCEMVSWCLEGTCGSRSKEQTSVSLLMVETPKPKNRVVCLLRHPASFGSRFILFSLVRRARSASHSPPALVCGPTGRGPMID